MRATKIIFIVLVFSLLLIGYARKFKDRDPVPGKELTVASQADFDQMVLNSGVPVLVDFWATWCPPCRAMEPVVRDVSVELDGLLRVAKVDVDNNQELAASYKIESIPTFMIFHRGQVIAQRVGGAADDEFRQWLADELGKAGVSINAPVM